MSSNHHLAPRVLEPECGRYAALLPVLDEAGTDPRAAAQAREHVAGCAQCRADLAAYDRLEGELRRHFGPETAPRLSTADLLWSSTGLPLEDIMHDVPDTTPSTPPHDGTASDIPDRPAFPALPNLTARHPRGPRRLISAVAALAAVLALAVGAQVLFTGSHGHLPGVGHGKATATATSIGANAPVAQLDDIAMVSATDIWAGGANTAANGSNNNAGYLMHFNGKSWIAIRAPCGCVQSIEAISMVSATDGLAAGNPNVMLHFDGNTWARVPLPTSNNVGSGDFAALDMVSPTQGWAIEWGGSPLEYHNGQWTVMNMPAIPGVAQPYSVSLYGVAGTASGEAWIVGEADPQNTTTTGNNVSVTPGAPTGILLHAMSGRLMVAEALPNTVLRDVSLVSASEGWAVGESVKLVTTGLPNAIPPIPASTATVNTPLVLHLANGQWHQAPTPQMTADFSQGSLMKVAMGSAGDGWALEQVNGTYDYYPNSATISNALLHYANGQWQQVAFPRILNRMEASIAALAAAPSGDAWAVGWSQWPSVPDGASGNYTIPRATPLILHYQGGAWTVFES